MVIVIPNCDFYAEFCQFVYYWDDHYTVFFCGWMTHVITSPLVVGAKYGKHYVCMSMSVYLSVHLHIGKNRVSKFQPISGHVTCCHDFVLFDDSAIHCILPVLWMTSCLHIMRPLGQYQRWCICFIEFTRRQHWWQSCYLQLQACCICCIAVVSGSENNEDVGSS